MDPPQEVLHPKGSDFTNKPPGYWYWGVDTEVVEKWQSYLGEPEIQVVC